LSNSCALVRIARISGEINSTLQPIGSFGQAEAPAQDKLVRFAAAFFGIETGALPPLDMKVERITSRHNPSTGQLLTTDLIETLRKRLPDDAFALPSRWWIFIRVQHGISCSGRRHCATVWASTALPVTPTGLPSRIPTWRFGVAVKC